MGLLAGFIGGAGAGLADVAKTSYKDMLDNQKVEKQNAFDLERDQIESDRKRAAFKEGITLQRDLETQYGKEDMFAVTTAINQAGGDLNKAMSLAPTTAQQEIIMKMMKIMMEQDVGKANILQSEASADASRAHANYYNIHANSVGQGKSDREKLDVKSAINSDGSATLVKENGQVLRVVSEEMLRQQAKEQSQIWADQAGEGLFASRPSSDKVTAKEKEIFGQLMTEQNSAIERFNGSQSQGDGLISQSAQAQTQANQPGNGQQIPQTGNGQSTVDYYKNILKGGAAPGQPGAQGNSPASAPVEQPAISAGAKRREQLEAQGGNKGGPTNATVISGAGIDELPGAAKATGNAAVDYATKVGSLTKENFKFLNDVYQAFVGQPFESMAKSIVAEQGAQRKAMMAGAAIKALEKQYSDGNISPEQFDASYDRLVKLAR